MNQGKFVFSQLMALASPTSFTTCTNRYNGNYKAKHFTCWKQFLCMVFGQLTHRESLSDTMLCLTANADKLYHMGIGEAVSLNTLSKANEKRDWQICLPVEQLWVQANRDSGPLQTPLENWTVLQMDKATPENKILLGNFCQCGENTNLDCNLSLCYCGNS